jgi:CelD/BcsL family acetyltransferase involved in cellulose biosynthesis
MGTGVSDYLGGLFISGESGRIAKAALQESLLANQDWDFCDLQELRPDSPLLTCPLPQLHESETAVQSVCPYLDLRRRSNELQDFLPPAMRKRLRRHRRVLDDAGKIERCHGKNLEMMLQNLFSLHQSRWVARGQSGMFAEPAVVRFHRAAAKHLEQSGALRLYRLMIEGRVAAAFYGFSSSDATYGYLQGFDPELARFSAGTVLLGHAVEQAALEGKCRFDFLRGTEDYKYSWGAANAFTYRRKLIKNARRH